LDGQIFLAPKEDRIEGPSEDFFLSLVTGPDGISYLGTGHSGKIYRIGKDGKAELYAQTPEMDVTCLAIDGKGALYAGTSPNGKIYKMSSKGQPEMFFNPGEKYIWDLLFVENGVLLAAVGETGVIYRINPKGEGQQILKAEENHILCLKKGSQGDVFAGTGGVGVVYKVGTDGRASVLFESPFEEIRSLALDAEGQVYAAAGGSPSRTKKEETPEAEVKISTEVTVTAPAAAPSRAATPSAPSAAPSMPAFPSPAAAKEPGAVYLIRPDGIAKKLWESSDELVYSLLWNEGEKKLLFGTGSRGRIYSVDKDGKVALVIQGNSEQVYGLVPSGSKVYALANNPSRLTVFSAEQRLNGEFTSDVLDTKTVSSWGKLEFEGDLAAGTILQVQTRSGNSFEPNSLWSDWSPPIQKPEEQILSPKARYLQVKVLFKAPSGNVSPILRRIALYYLQTNLAPVFQKLELLPANEVYLKPPEQDDVIWGAEDLISGSREKKLEDRSVYIAKKVERKGYQTVVWEATDENGDDLVYTVSLKKQGESTWRVVKEGWRDSLFVFDTVSYPDGFYTVKVEASDRPSNPPGMELKTEKLSTPILIDNSLPTIKNFTALRSQNALEVAFEAEDSFSAIEQAEYLVRPGEWRVVFPADGICDSKLESFKFRAPLAADGENIITVRVTDRHHNIGVYRQSF
jgi:hypothetical protein